MEPIFNSLFDNDNEFNSSNAEEFYPIDKVDDTQITSTILLTFDEQKLHADEVLSQRNFGDSKDYRLGPRPCSTRHASSDKFCEYPGLPEVYEEKKDKCRKTFMPNTSIGDRSQYLRNIDLEHKILQMDFNDSKCDNKKSKEDMCSENDPNCSLSCENNILRKDRLSVKRSQGNPIENNRLYCNAMNQSFNQIKNDFLTFRPTKRKNTITW